MLTLKDRTGDEGASPLATDWDQFFDSLARKAASKSKDRSTQVGAVVVAEGSHDVLQLGWNGFPRGVDDDVEERHQRPAKYLYTEHAERNAIYNAARRGIALEGATIYATQMPCCDCARAIIQSGITRVVTVEPVWNDPHLLATQHLDVSRELLAEAGVDLVFPTFPGS